MSLLLTPGLRTDAVLRGVARVALAGNGESGGVEPDVERGTVGVGVARDVDALAVAATGEIGALDGAEADCERAAADEPADAAEAPAIQNRPHEGVIG
jgi:hypothetical protein